MNSSKKYFRTISSIFRSKFFIIPLVLFSSFLLILSVFSNFSEINFLQFFSTDTLYLPTLYIDLFRDQHFIRDWRLNPAPAFFPDMFFYFGLMFLTSGKFIVASFLFSIIQYILILLFFRYVLKLLFLKSSEIYFGLIFIFLSLNLLEPFFFTKDFLSAFYLLSNAYHHGAFVLAVFGLIFLLKQVQLPKPSQLIVLFFITLLGVVSDKLFIVLFTLPVIFTVCFFYKKLRLRNAIILIITISFSSLLGIKWFDFLIESGFTQIGNPNKIFAFEDIKSSFELLREQVSIYMSEFGFKGVTYNLFFLGFIFRVGFLFYIRKKEELSLLTIYIFFSICFDVVVAFAPVLNGCYTGYDTLRYNIYPLYFAALNSTIIIVFFMQKFKSKTFSKIGKSLTLMFVFSILFFGITKTSRAGLSDYFNYKPTNAKIINAISKKHNLKCGVSNYWESKSNMLFLDKKQGVYAVFDDLSLYESAANIKWFYGDNVFNYIILNNFKDTISFKKYFSKIEVINDSNGLYLIKVPEFKYVQSMGYQPILIK